jgi:hypothetical protein
MPHFSACLCGLRSTGFHRSPPPPFRKRSRSTWSCLFSLLASARERFGLGEARGTQTCTCSRTQCSASGQARASVAGLSNRPWPAPGYTRIVQSLSRSRAIERSAASL